MSLSFKNCVIVFTHVKKKRQICLCASITKHYATKTYGGVDVEIQIFSTSALVGSEWSVSRPGRFTPKERDFDIHWIEGWVGLKAGLDDMEK
jgi:hypothetical protein